MSAQQVEALESLLGRIKERAGGQNARLNLSAFVDEAIPEPAISEVEAADDDFYDALTSPGRQAPSPSTAAMLAVNTDELSPPPELSPLPEPVAAADDEPMAAAEPPAAEPAHQLDDSATRIGEPLSDSGIEITSADDIVIEDDVPAVAEAAPSELIELPATSEEMAPTEPATAISAMEEFDPPPAERARPTQAVAPNKAAPPPLPGTGPTKASLDVPPAPAPAEALAQAGRLIVGPEVIERASIPTVQVAEMMGAAAVSQSRNFGDVLNGSLKLRFKPPKAG